MIDWPGDQQARDQTSSRHSAVGLGVYVKGKFPLANELEPSTEILFFHSFQEHS